MLTNQVELANQAAKNAVQSPMRTSFLGFAKLEKEKKRKALKRKSEYAADQLN
jgi:hypothetical protein